MAIAARIPGALTRTSYLLILSVLLPLGPLEAQQPVPGGMDTERLTALGRVLSEAVERHETILQDENVAAYLRQLSAKLDRGANAGPSVSVLVLATPEPRAIALPGGRLYLSAGLIARLRSESELAAVMAHETAHIRLRHGMQPASGVVGGGTKVPLIFLGGWNGVCARFATGPEFPAIFRSAAAEYEPRADEFAREQLIAASLDSTAVSRVFDRLGETGTLDQQAKRASKDAPRESSPEFERFRMRIEALMPSGQFIAPSLFPAGN